MKWAFCLFVLLSMDFVDIRMNTYLLYNEVSDLLSILFYLPIILTFTIDDAYKLPCSLPYFLIRDLIIPMAPLM